MQVTHTVILSLQQDSGVFAGDRFGEIDTRFLYCAVNALSPLGHLHELDVEKTVGYIRKCRNFDGGFGAREGAESHATQGQCICSRTIYVILLTPRPRSDESVRMRGHSRHLGQTRGGQRRHARMVVGGTAATKRWTEWEA